MSPGDMSRLAAKLATVEGVKPAHVAVVLSIAAQSGKDGGAVISAARLAQRCGMSKGHAWRSIQWAYHANLLQIENVDGRSNRYVFETTCSAGATGVARPRDGGDAPARHVSSTHPVITSSASAARPLEGPQPEAGEAAEDEPRMSFREFLDAQGMTSEEAMRTEWG